VNPVIQHREWLIQPEALQSMAASLRGMVDRGGFLPKQAPESSLLSIEDGIGVVAMEGPILRKPDVFARIFFDATSSEDIGEALREAGERDDIKAVLLNIDSPGGTVAGTPELAAAVKALNEIKPVYAFSSGLMCSAAYWVASQARAIYATPSAQVGSIGVVQAVIDNTVALDKAGLKVEVFSVGKYKAMGAPGTPLTDDQRELIQSNLAEIAAEFHDAVLSRGRAIPAEAMEGQTFSGKQAQRHNLAGMVPDRTEALRRLRVYHTSVDTRSRAMNNSIEDELAEARTQVVNLQRDHQAQTDLLNEASTSVDSLRGEVELLSAEIDSLKADRDDAKNQAANLITERDASKAQVTSMQSRITDLEASQTDFDRKLQLEVARVVASTGTTMPAHLTPAGDASLAADIHARFAAITDPAEQTAFWRKLTPEQQALILKHQA
jgi:signal peptide peptidase SppA